MSKVGEAAATSRAFEPRGVTARQSIDAATTSADDMVMVMAGRDEGIKATTSFQGVPLDDARLIEGFEATVDRDKVEGAIARRRVDFFGAERALGFREDL